MLRSKQTDANDCCWIYFLCICTYIIFFFCANFQWIKIIYEYMIVFPTQQISVCTVSSLQWGDNVGRWWKKNVRLSSQITTADRSSPCRAVQRRSITWPADTRFRRRRDVIARRCRRQAEKRRITIIWATDGDGPSCLAMDSGHYRLLGPPGQTTSSTGSENCIQTSLIGPFEAEEVMRSDKIRSARRTTIPFRAADGLMSTIQ